MSHRCKLIERLLDLRAQSLCSGRLGAAVMNRLPTALWTHALRQKIPVHGTQTKSLPCLNLATKALPVVHSLSLMWMIRIWLLVTTWSSSLSTRTVSTIVILLSIFLREFYSFYFASWLIARFSAMPPCTGKKCVCAWFWLAHYGTAVS